MKRSPSFQIQGTKITEHKLTLGPEEKHKTDHRWVWAKINQGEKDSEPPLPSSRPEQVTEDK